MFNIEEELKKAYQSPLLNEVKKFEDDRKRMLDAVLGSPSFEQTANDMQGLLKSTGFQDAFRVKEDYEKYTDPILKDIEKHDYESLQKELLKTFEPYLKPNISATLKSLSITENSLSKLAKQSTVGLDGYSSSVSKALNDIANNNDLLEASKSLTSSFKAIDTDMFHHKMDELDSRRLEIKNLPTIDIPKNPMVEQNKRIIEQLDIQNEALTSIGTYISSQNEKLDIQNEIVKEQIKDNKSSANKAMWVAIISICISIIVTVIAIWVSYDVYDKENISSSLQHQELLKKIKEGDNSKLMTKQTEVLNKILKTLEKQNGNYAKLYEKMGRGGEK